MSLNNMEIESLRKYAARSGEIFIREVSNKNFPGKGKEKEDIKRDLLQNYTSNARYGKFYGNTELIRDKRWRCFRKVWDVWSARDETVSHEHYCIRLIRASAVHYM